MTRRRRTTRGKRKRIEGAPDPQRDARQFLVDAANDYTHERWGTAKYSLRRLQQAVCCVRQNQLVDPYMIELAGFRPTR